jgi:hypothetical protein
MLRTVVHKKDSFLVKYILHNELAETLVKPYIETNVDTNLFDIEHKGVQYTWWHNARSGYGFVWAEVLRAKDSTPEGYYRFKNPIAYYKLASDAETDPWRAVSLTPVDVILTTKHVVLVIDKPNWDPTKPYADTILEKLRSVFRVIEKDESTDKYDISEIMGCYRVCNSNATTVGYVSDNSISFGVNLARYNIYKEETAEADVVVPIKFFGFNLPETITVAKAGETLRYFDIRYIQDNELIPLVADGNKAFVLLHRGGLKLLIAENSFLENDEIYNLIANVLAIFNIAGAEIKYYLESNLTDTFTLPDNLIITTFTANPNCDLGTRQGILEDGRFVLPADKNLTAYICIHNISKDIKTIDKYEVFVNGVLVNSASLDVTLAVLGAYTAEVSIPAQPSTVVTGETVGTGDGSKTKFYLSKTPVKEGSEKIYINGVLKTRGNDYTIDYETGEITFATAPADGATITADYIYYVPFKISFLDPNGVELAKLERLATFE